MVLCSLFASLTAVCAWIAIPLPGISVTMQTFAVLLALGTLGGRWGTVSTVLYLLMGLVGLPVFTGFRGGAAALLDPTGGFLWGFGVCALVYWALERVGKLPAMILGLAGCYLCGCWWFSVCSGISLGAAAAACLLSCLVPDGIKLALAWSVAKRIRRAVRI